MGGRRRGTRGATHEGGQPELGRLAMLVHQSLHPRELLGAPRDDRELRLAALEVEPAHDAVVPLLDEEGAGAGLELLTDQLELALAQAKSLRVLLGAGITVGKEHLGGGLLDQRAAYRARQHVARALRRKAHDPVQLAPGLRPVLRKGLKGRVGEEPPELIHPAHQAPPVEELAYEMEHVEREGRATRLVLEEFSDVEA